MDEERVKFINKTFPGNIQYFVVSLIMGNKSRLGYESFKLSNNPFITVEQVSRNVQSRHTSVKSCRWRISSLVGVLPYKEACFRRSVSWRAAPRTASEKKKGRFPFTLAVLCSNPVFRATPQQTKSMKTTRCI